VLLQDLLEGRMTDKQTRERKRLQNTDGEQ